MSSGAAVNRQVRLRSRPAGIPRAENFEVVETAIPEPGEGEVLVRNRFLAVEPAMRGWVSAVANYAEPVALGAVMRSFAAGDVVRSRNADYSVWIRDGRLRSREEFLDGIDAAPDAIAGLYRGENLGRRLIRL